MHTSTPYEQRTAKHQPATNKEQKDAYGNPSMPKLPSGLQVARDCLHTSPEKHVYRNCKHRVSLNNWRAPRVKKQFVDELS